MNAKIKQTCQKLWGGRFDEDVDSDFHNLNLSINIDKRMYAEDIQWQNYAWYIKQDLERLLEVRKHVNILPLGSGAIAGNPFPIDRQFLAMDLGFNDITQNSMYAVGDRDFVAEFLFWSSLSSVHLSRFCEDLIIYNTQEFNFVKFADKYSTGSSLMPQKRNPDCMELIRGKTGTILGKCIGFMITLKGIPSTYNKDLQEDKEVLFHTYDMLYQIYHIIKKSLKTLKINKETCKNALTSDMLATDMAYYLVSKGIPFRESHHLVGKVVALAESKGISLLELTIQELKTISEAFEDNVSCIWDFICSVDQYQTTGGTGLMAVRQQINNLKSWLHDFPFKK
ncbi:argininosuccinate lyase [Pogonomyrmex barbatus]|uniref:Arginosuccinase n=1 Tax=Pogonomyrmex barbatus TaxID=144034 RepID=A0A8N1S6J0_9HYME|nr:argininosuccinate lyase [Pogonomyrmex barbatus]